MGNAMLCCQTREPPQDPDATSGSVDEEADAVSSKTTPKPEPNIGFIDFDSERCTPEDSNKSK